MLTDPAAIRAAKATMRAALLATRATLPARWREEYGHRLAVAARADERIAAARRVTAYVGVGGEPATGPLLDALRGNGGVVLLPVLAPGHQLVWAQYEGRAALAAGRYGLLEPTGERLAPAAAADVDLLLVPALAVDRRGHRLGRGGGYYDRLLGSLGGTPPALAVVYPAEVLNEVPVEAHDERVAGVLTADGVSRWA